MDLTSANQSSLSQLGPLNPARVHCRRSSRRFLHVITVITVFSFPPPLSLILLKQTSFRAAGFYQRTKSFLSLSLFLFLLARFYQTSYSTTIYVLYINATIIIMYICMRSTPTRDSRVKNSPRRTPPVPFQLHILKPCYLCNYWVPTSYSVGEIPRAY